MKTTLTKKEAIEQGYFLCGYQNQEWQMLKSIEDLDETDFENSKLYIAEKEGSSPHIDAKAIKELIADTVNSNWGEDTGDDTDQAWDTVDKLDFTGTEKMVNEALSSIKCYKLTQIALIYEG